MTERTWLCIQGKCIHYTKRTVSYTVPSFYGHGPSTRRTQLEVWCHKKQKEIIKPKYKCKDYTTRRLDQWVKEETTCK